MDLYKEILVNILQNEGLEIVFSNLKINAKEIIEIESYKALEKTKNIIDDDSLDDSECFLKIEEIVCIFESLGSNSGNRHDF